VFLSLGFICAKFFCCGWVQRGRFVLTFFNLLRVVSLVEFFWEVPRAMYRCEGVLPVEVARKAQTVPTSEHPFPAKIV